MRAEEMSVVNAAIALYHAEGTKSTISIAMAENDLRQVTQALIFSCPQCNTGTHKCPGCGVDIGHFEGACGQCTDDSTSTMVNGDGSVLWAAVEKQDPGIMTRRFVSPDQPVINASTYPCRECTDPDEDPRSWCDCGGRTDIYGECAPPCCSRAHDPKDCPNNPDRCRCSRTEKVYCAAENCHGGADLAQEPVEPVEPEPEYVPAEWQHVLAGDRVRLGTQEAEVTRSSVGTWHADNSDRYRSRPWKHAEVSISLAHLDRPLIMAPGGPVEILADRERAAVLVLQKAFPEVA